MLSHHERGRLGAKSFWGKYETDKNFRNKVINKWRQSRIRNYKASNKYVANITNREKQILKARLCGFLAADGSVFIRKEPNTGKVHHEIKFYPDDHKLVEIFAISFKKLYGKDVHIKQERKYYRVSICNKTATRDLLSIANFSSKNWTFPKIIKSRSSKIEWLKSYFDCDGYVGKKYIQLQSVNKEGLEQIQKLLNDFGIVSKIYTYKRKQKSWNINYLLNINRKDMIIRFHKEIGLRHTLKKERLESLISAEVA